MILVNKKNADRKRARTDQRAQTIKKVPQKSIDRSACIFSIDQAGPPLAISLSSIFCKRSPIPSSLDSTRSNLDSMLVRSA